MDSNNQPWAWQQGNTPSAPFSYEPEIAKPHRHRDLLQQYQVAALDHGVQPNGNINYSPDFVAMAKASKSILIEFKGDNRGISNSRMKLELGHRRQTQTGADVQSESI